MAIPEHALADSVHLAPDEGPALKLIKSDVATEATTPQHRIVSPWTGEHGLTPAEYEKHVMLQTARRHSDSPADHSTRKEAMDPGLRVLLYTEDYIYPKDGETGDEYGTRLDSIRWHVMNLLKPETTPQERHLQTQYLGFLSAEGIVAHLP